MRRERASEPQGVGPRVHRTVGAHTGETSATDVMMQE
jgi:hypothetical protein